MKDDEPVYWTPKRAFAAIAVSACLVGVGAVALGPLGAAQLGGGECDAAVEWHLGEALKWSKSHDGGQEYHLYAVQAAQALEAAGGSCSGWDADAGPWVMDGNGEYRPPATEA